MTTTKTYTNRAVTSTAPPTVPRRERQPTSAIDAASRGADVEGRRAETAKAPAQERHGETGSPARKEREQATEKEKAQADPAIDRSRRHARQRRDRGRVAPLNVAALRGAAIHAATVAPMMASALSAKDAR